MSLDNPNEYEKAIEGYADAVRREKVAMDAFEKATTERADAQVARQTAWRKVSAYVNQGLIKPGIYRLNKGPGPYADGVLIEAHHDYPDLFPMFR